MRTERRAPTGQGCRKPATRRRGCVYQRTRGFTQPSRHVDRIAGLKAAVKNGDPDEIERKSKELADAFSHDKDYRQHLADLAEAQRKREAQYLLDAIHRGEKERDFILDYVGKNPLADANPALVVASSNSLTQRFSAPI